jgi:hypothetical protein
MQLQVDEVTVNPKVKLALNILATGATGGLYAIFWLGWVVYQKWHASEVAAYQKSELIKNTKFEISEIQESLIHLSALDQWLTKLDVALPTKGIIVKIPSVRLYESRVGASITSTSGTLQAQTKTGTVGIGTKLGPVGVGLGASKGETRGTINSSSVTRAGKDEMTKIDEGDLILSADSIAFAGAQFSRTTSFDLLLNWQVERNEILISSKNSEKNWLLALNSDSVAASIGQLIEHVASSKEGALGASKESSLIASLKSSNSNDTELFQEELTRKENSLKEIESQI